MRNPIIYLSALIITTILMTSCKKEPIFADPTVEILNYSLKSFPADSIYLDIVVEITNNDQKEPDISSIEYQVNVEGIFSKRETVKVDQVLKNTTPLELTLPLSFSTSDALDLVSTIEIGNTLHYSISGEIHLNDRILKLFAIPINVDGTALVEVGYEEFLQDPEISISDVAIDYQVQDFVNYQFDLDVECLIYNPNPIDLTVSHIEYTITIEDLSSEPSRIPELGADPFNIPASNSITIEFPITYKLSLEQALPLILAISEGQLGYEVNGTVHISKVNSIPFELTLPLHLSGEF